LYVVIRDNLCFSAEYAVVRKLTVTPIDLLLVEFGLRRDGERDEPGSLVRFVEPSVGHYRLVVFPLTGKFEMLGYAKDVGVLVGPDLAIAWDSDDLVDRE